LTPGAHDPTTVEGAVESRRRRNAVRALGHLGRFARSAVYDLAVAVAQDADEEVRLESAHALSRLGPAALLAVPGLTAALHDSRASVRAAAAVTLHEIWRAVMGRPEEPFGRS